jgi:hypothetical protein
MTSETGLNLIRGGQNNKNIISPHFSRNLTAEDNINGKTNLTKYSENICSLPKEFSAWWLRSLMQTKYYTGFYTAHA